MLFQYGKLPSTSDSSSIKNVVFPITYKKLFYVGTTQGQNSSTEESLYRFAYNSTKSGFSIRVYIDNTTSCYLAIGST